MPLPLLILACALVGSAAMAGSFLLFSPDSPVVTPFQPPGIPDRPPGEIVIEVPFEITIPSFWDYVSLYMNDIMILSCVIILIIGIGWWLGRSKRKTIERTAKQLRGGR